MSLHNCDINYAPQISRAPPPPLQHTHSPGWHTHSESFVAVPYMLDLGKAPELILYVNSMRHIQYAS
jgi:hypothetical protein